MLAVTIIEDNKTLLLGILGPGEFAEHDPMTSAYEMISKNTLYSSDLKPLPKSNLPKEFSQIDMYLVSDGRGAAGRLTKILPGNIAAAICQKTITADNMHYSSGVSLYDISNKKTCGYIDLGDYIGLETSVNQGKLIVKASKLNSRDTTVFTIDSKGNITSDIYTPEKNYLLYSPDQSRYAYTNKGSIYVVDSKDNIPKLMAEGNDSDGQDRAYYYPYAWNGNSELVYGIGGYEWSNGCGVINVDTGKNIFFEQFKGSYPIASRNGKFYTITPEDIDIHFDPYVIDLNDRTYTGKKLFKDRDFVEVITGPYSFSPDGEKIAILKCTNELEKKFILYICSSEDGSIIKSCEFQTPITGSMYLDFFEDDRIAIYTEPYAFLANYMYIVEIR